MTNNLIIGDTNNLLSSFGIAELASILFPSEPRLFNINPILLSQSRKKLSRKKLAESSHLCKYPGRFVNSLIGGIE